MKPLTALLLLALVVLVMRQRAAAAVPTPFLGYDAAGRPVYSPPAGASDRQKIETTVGATAGMVAGTAACGPACGAGGAAIGAYGAPVVTTSFENWGHALGGIF